MTLKAVSATACWELPYQDDNEWRRHYATVDEAMADLAEEIKEATEDLYPGDKLEDERPDLLDSSPRQNTYLCCWLICDGDCGLAMGLEEMVDLAQGSHVQADDVQQFVNEWGWREVDGGRRHYCSRCTVPVDQEAEARRPGPDDVPLWGDQA